MNIREALQQLDPGNDDHWTTSGLPRVDAVAGLIGVDGLTRNEITEVAPSFSRASPELPDSADPATPPESQAVTGAGLKTPGVYEREIQDAAAEIRAITDQIASLEAKRRGLEDHCTRLITERDRVYPKPGSTEVIMEWQRAQHRQRLAQAQAFGIPEMNGRGDQPSPALAPIDQAFSDRRRGMVPQAALLPQTEE